MECSYQGLSWMVMEVLLTPYCYADVIVVFFDGVVISAQGTGIFLRTIMLPQI